MKVINRVAVEAQHSLSVLSGMNLPVKASLSLARLALALEQQVSVCLKVRDALMKEYKIKVTASDIPDKVNINTFVTGADSGETQKLKEQFLLEFTNKVNELMNAEGEEVATKIYLPENLEINSAVLKPLVSFIELAN